MPLRLPDPPERGEAIIREALSSAARQPTAAALVAEAGPQNLTTAAPHEVYFVGLRDLARGRLLAVARPRGWRYIVLKDDRPLTAAELKGGGESVSFSNFNRGPFVASTVEGVGRAEALEVVREEDFELRVLEVPGLYFVALWLHGARQLIIPLPPTPEPFEPFGVYEEGAVIESLRGAAERRLSFDDRPRA